VVFKLLEMIHGGSLVVYDVVDLRLLPSVPKMEVEATGGFNPFDPACRARQSLPIVGLSRLRRGSSETHGMGFARTRQGCFGLFLCGLIYCFCLTLIFCNW
jgi:hypothetical protein